ncbi:hypothetical protein [Mesorhizobium sp. M0802]|uniref:hypothetical protein n=1 Tax=Mesorhizobium sp. M0802 TaxID=2957001 RepID=UPI0033367816
MTGEALSNDLLELLGEADFIRFVENFAGCRCYVPRRTTMPTSPLVEKDVTADHLVVLDDLERKVFDARQADQPVPYSRLASQLLLTTTGDGGDPGADAVRQIYASACRKVNLAAGHEEQSEKKSTLLAEAIGEDAAQKLIDRYAGAFLRVPMARELRAAHYRAQGLSNPKIAVRLGIVETSVDKLFRRMKLTAQERQAANNNSFRHHDAANDDRPPKRRPIRAAGDE